MPVSFRGQISMYGLGFREHPGQNAEDFPVFRKILQLPSSGLMPLGRSRKLFWQWAVSGRWRTFSHLYSFTTWSSPIGQDAAHIFVQSWPHSPLTAHCYIYIRVSEMSRRTAIEVFAETLENLQHYTRSISESRNQILANTCRCTLFVTKYVLTLDGLNQMYA